MADGTREITRDNFKATVSQPGIVFLDWWASWCGPCRIFAPTFEKVAAQNPDVVFGKIDTEAQPELAAANAITSIPTLMILRDGILLFSEAGALPERALTGLLTQVRGLDMEKIRAEVGKPNPERKAAAST